MAQTPAPAPKPSGKYNTIADHSKGMNNTPATGKNPGVQKTPNGKTQTPVK